MRGGGEVKKLMAFLVVMSLAVVVTYWDGNEIRRTTADNMYSGDEGISLYNIDNPADRNPRIRPKTTFPYRHIIRIDRVDDGKIIPWYRR
jgi:hypothetical protein